MYNTISNFTGDDPDLLILISDINNKQRNIESEHRTLLEQKKFTQASQYLNSQNGITPISANLFNLIINRISKTQSYLQTLASVKQVDNSSAEPATKYANMNWTSDVI